MKLIKVACALFVLMSASAAAVAARGVPRVRLKQ